jgi:hypothetical protein
MLVGGIEIEENDSPTWPQFVCQNCLFSSIRKGEVSMDFAFTKRREIIEGGAEALASMRNSLKQVQNEYAGSVSFSFIHRYLQ